MMPSERGRWMAVDWGERRIGLALSDPIGHDRAARPGDRARRAGKRPPIAELVRRAEALEARGIVMGLPLDGEGEDTPRCDRVPPRGGGARAAHEAARGAARRTLHHGDRAARDPRDGGQRRGRKGDVDALAATVLLQQALRMQVLPASTPMRRRPATRRRVTSMRRLTRLARAAMLATTVALAACRGAGTGRVRVIVPHGATMRVAADSLAHAGVVQNATAFRLYAMLRGSDRSIRAGTYVFQRGGSWGEVLDDLRGGKGLEHAITIPEGWSLYQIVPQLARVLDAAGRFGAGGRARHRAAPRARRADADARGIPVSRTRTSSRTARRRARRCASMVDRFEQRLAARWTSGCRRSR